MHRTIRRVIGALVCAGFFPVGAWALSASGGGPVMVMRADRLQQLAEVDAQAARRYFDTPSAYVQVLRDKPRTLASARALKAQGWRFHIAETFVNEADLEKDLAAGAMPHDIDTAIYDNENDYTSPAETSDGGFADPTSRRAAARRFYRLAKSRNLTVVLAPGTLCNRPSISNGGRDRCISYLTDLAPFADVIDFQFQSLIETPEVYQTLLKRASSSVRRANPKVKVLSTFALGPAVPLTPPRDAAAMNGSASAVDGFWLNLNTADVVPGGDAILRQLK